MSASNSGSSEISVDGLRGIALLWFMMCRGWGSGRWVFRRNKRKVSFCLEAAYIYIYIWATLTDVCLQQVSCDVTLNR